MSAPGRLRMSFSSDRDRNSAPLSIRPTAHCTSAVRLVDSEPWPGLCRVGPVPAAGGKRDSQHSEHALDSNLGAHSPPQVPASWRGVVRATKAPLPWAVDCGIVVAAAVGGTR